MTEQAARADTDPFKPGVQTELADFSLVLGGPLYQFLRRTRLQDRLQDHLLRRILVISGLLWLPLLLLCLLERTLLGGVPVPFITDIETHARFLVSIPLLIIAEVIIHIRLRGVVAQFVERKLLPDAQLQQFTAALHRLFTLRNSKLAEIMLLVLLLPLGYYLRSDLLALDASTWYARVVDGNSVPTLAGYWYWGFSNPVMQFLVLRWYFRLLLWMRFLWQVSRIELALIPTHPDRAAGLGFLGGSAHALTPFLAAHGAALSGALANRIFHTGATLPEFKLEIVLIVAIMMLIVLGPLCVFTPQIRAAKRRGLREYGAFAADYDRAFDQRWLRQADHDGEALLGTGDIQSLADLGNAYSVIKETGSVPFGRDTFTVLVLATVAPIAPLLFTMFPLDELLDRVIGAVL